MLKKKTSTELDFSPDSLMNPNEKDKKLFDNLDEDLQKIILQNGKFVSLTKRKTSCR
jgi:hypothetical protein